MTIHLRRYSIHIIEIIQRYHNIHFDPDYTYPSSPSKLCHRKSHKHKHNTAGRFGSIQTDCDSPYILTNSTFEFLKKNFSQVDFIIYTGDSCRHDRDLKDPVVEEDILYCHQNLIEWFTKYFDPKKVKIIPTLGNNDLWVPDCKKKNSPGSKQLKWIKRELINAREENRKIYISHHVPPLDDKGNPAYYKKCYEKYILLLGDYSDVIYGHFTGHTNLDTLTFVTFDEINNPAIREYVYSTKDDNFGTLLNYYQYFTNLTEANNIGKIRWELEYTAKELYGINHLQGNDWEKVLQEFRKPNLELWERYKKYVNVINEYLTAARNAVSFPIEELTNFLYDGTKNTARHRWLRSLIEPEKEPILDTSDTAFLNREERYLRNLQMIKRLLQIKKQHNLSFEDWSILLLLQGQMSKEQLDKWLPLAENYEIIELGHGSNIKKLETTSTYIRESDEFELHSPTLTSMKW
ncbi:6887_t:CDS:10 [Diversispora eburnea]|uniref:6887_t:CDS:1 n=1 Tax=Diversispora eburnea TaxID=1213867 RepID=A0A9N8V417_9GLOM|nr:6887_t:CDS:10 [Diversispora eburnea]